MENRKCIFGILNINRKMFFIVEFLSMFSLQSFFFKYSLVDHLIRNTLRSRLNPIGITTTSVLSGESTLLVDRSQN